MKIVFSLTGLVNENYSINPVTLLGKSITVRVDGVPTKIGEITEAYISENNLVICEGNIYDSSKVNILKPPEKLDDSKKPSIGVCPYCGRVNCPDKDRPHVLIGKKGLGFNMGFGSK